MLAVIVCPSIHPSHAGIVSKKLHTGSRKQHRTVAKGFRKIRMGLPPVRVPNAGGNRKCMHSTECIHCRWPWVTPNSPNHPSFYILCCLSYLVVGEHRDFKSGVMVDYSKSHPMDSKLALKGVWSRHITHFKFLIPLIYLWDGLS